MTTSVQHHNTKRIARNTLMLYFRMGISMLVSLYTSRIVLSTLGVEDYGVYNVVGGVVAMFSFLTVSMSTATSRFLTVAIGKGDFEELKKIFSASFTVHILLMLFVVLIAEIVGLWFLENKLVIPVERMNAARIVFQLSVLSTAISITQVPYNALIIAHEKINIYAYFEILNTFLKLAIVIALPYIGFDKMIIYAILVVVISALIQFLNRYYCSRNFKEVHSKLIFEKTYITPLLSFSGWDLYGNMSVMARTQGVNMLLNIFFGPILNAASGIATAVQSAVGAFAGNIVTAVRPQIQKLFAAGELGASIRLMSNYTKYSFLLLSILTVPLLIEMPYILSLWLTTVPEYTIILCRLTLIFNLFANTSVALMTVIHATGKIKFSSLLNGTLYLSVIPFAYIFFKKDFPPFVPYILNVIFVYIGLTMNSIYLKRFVKEFSIFNFHKVLFICIFITVIAFAIGMLCSYVMPQSFFRVLVIGCITTVFIILPAYSFLLNRSEREVLKKAIKKWTTKKI